MDTLPARDSRQSGFTMVEIAISLAVIAFALVAIIGVLPLGMNVQKDNREETIVGQDAGLLIDAIRNGAKGLDDLTNYIIVISNTVYQFDVKSNLVGSPTLYGYSPGDYSVTVGNATSHPTDPTRYILTNGADIIGLLSTPKYVPTNNGALGFFSNYVFADFQAMSGPAADKFPQRDTNIQSFAFSYRVFCEIAPVPTLVTNFNNINHVMTSQTNLHDLRLGFRWPLLANGSGIGPNRQVYRTQISGRMVGYTNEGRPLFFFDNKNFATISALP